MALSPLAFSQVLFAGVSSMEARAGADRSVQIINFQADLPFQYQTQVLDRNTVLIRLYNARLAQNLITPEGGVNLLAGGAVQSARLTAPTGFVADGETVQDIVISGPGLGGLTLQVLGAKKRVTQKSGFSSNMMMARVSGQGPKHASTHSKQASRGFDFSNLQAVAASGGVIHDDNHPSSRVYAAQDRPGIAAVPARIDLQEISTQQSILRLSPGPKITAMTGASGVVYPNESAASGNAKPENDSPQTGGWMQSAEVSAAPEPSNTTMIAMPRYTGGAKPIQAMTTDNQGHPVLIQSKNQPIPEFGVGSSNGGYNTLFQAETDGRNSISQYVSDALGAYRAKAYDLAQKQMQQALLLDANNADLVAALAEIQLKQGYISLAQQNYQKAQALSPERYGPRYAQMLTLAGQRQEAIQVLESLYKQNPKQVQVAYMLGTLHEELGETGRALSYLQQAATLRPASADIQYNLGLAYELSGDRVKAEKHYRQALGLNPTAHDVTHALARVRQGVR